MQKQTKFYLLIFVLIFLNQTINSQILHGKIKNFANKEFMIYIHCGDSLVPVSRLKTNSNGEFIFDLKEINNVIAKLENKYKFTKFIFLRIELHKERNQYADFLILSSYKNELSVNSELPYKGELKDIRISLTYNPSLWFNFATDSAVVRYSVLNKNLYKFLKQYRKVQVAESWLIEMSRLFPYTDEFSKTLINEYYKRYKKMEILAKEFLKSPNRPDAKVALAYYRPVVPQHDLPDEERFKIFRKHFWDYFDPNDSLFAFSPVLIDKFEEWVDLHKKYNDKTARLHLENEDIITAINTFIEKIDKNNQNKEIILRYTLKKLDKNEDKRLFLKIYDKWLKQEEKDSLFKDTVWNWAHKKASIYRNIVIGATAPNFDIYQYSISMHEISSDITLVVFWASWCNICRQEIPRIRDVINYWKSENYNFSLVPIFISLDYDYNEWENYIKDNKLEEFIHVCEFNGWKSSIPKKYNINAIPQIFILDRNKKIFATATLDVQLYYYLNKIVQK